jgi:hypothetical protein
MKRSIWLLAIVSIFGAVVLPPATLKAGDANRKSLTVATAQSSKDKKTKVCRMRYRDCLNKNQIPPFECQYIYQDCTNHIY